LKSGDKVRCIKTAPGFDEVFAEGKWYEILGKLSLRNDRGNPHYMSQRWFDKHFTTSKRLIDVAMEKTGKSVEELIGCCPEYYEYKKYMLCGENRRNWTANNNMCAACWNQTIEEEKPVDKCGESKFKPRDKVIGKKDNFYIRLSDKAIGEVLEVSEKGRLKIQLVKVLEGHKNPVEAVVGYIGEHYDPVYFELWEEKTMYVVGDKARVRSDLVAGIKYGGVRFCSEMFDCMGQIITVTRVDEDGHCDCTENHWHWSPEMLEPVNMVKCDSTDCENNSDGLCPKTYQELKGLGISDEDISKMTLDNGCHNYKRRENTDKELWENTLKRFKAIAKLSRTVYSALLNNSETIKKCPFCEQRKENRGFCSECGFAKVFGVCDSTGSKWQEIKQANVKLNHLLTSLCDDIHKKIDK